MKGSPNTDSDFCYNEEENTIYGIADKALKQYLYCISPETLNYSNIPLLAMQREASNGEKPITLYELHKCTQESSYLIRKCYDIGRKNHIYEYSYGRYEREGNTLVLKEKYLSTNEYRLTLFDITDQNSYRQFLEFCEKRGFSTTLLRIYRNGCELFYITDKAVFNRSEAGILKEVYRAENI